MKRLMMMAVVLGGMMVVGASQAEASHRHSGFSISIGYGNGFNNFGGGYGRGGYGRGFGGGGYGGGYYGGGYGNPYPTFSVPVYGGGYGGYGGYRGGYGGGYGHHRHCR